MPSADKNSLPSLMFEGEAKSWSYLFSSQPMNGSINLKCYLTLGWKSWPGTNNLAYWADSEVTNEMKCCKYVPWGHIHRDSIFFVTYKWAQLATVLDYTCLERLTTDKHSSLLGLFVSNKEN
jgi:hypothetical protein